MSLPRHILVPTDFSAMSDAALDQALDLAESTGADILLLHVFEPPKLDLPEAMVTGAADATDRILARAEKLLDSTMASRRSRKVAIDGVVESGKPWRVIVDTASRLEDGLVVMATHGRTGIPRMILGSVTEKVLRAAPCPVLTIPGGRTDEGG
jgi:nucleotide-binding universal stress UspA family protein